jgi:ABC-type dipeptide/oligopeptide/nickel transport system permease component
VNPRLRRSLARCRPGAGVIHLSPRVVAGDGRRVFSEALCHEFAHLAVRARHRRRTAPHGLEWKARMGLDRPLPAQYGVFLGRLARGDLGGALVIESRPAPGGRTA